MRANIRVHFSFQYYFIFSVIQTGTFQSMTEITISMPPHKKKIKKIKLLCLSIANVAGSPYIRVYGSLFQHILFISVKHSKTGQSPELLSAHRGHRVDPVLPLSGFIPSVKNRDAGENMSQRGWKGEKQCHCLTCAPLQLPLLPGVNVSPRKWKKRHFGKDFWLHKDTVATENNYIIRYTYCIISPCMVDIIACIWEWITCKLLGKR